MSTLPKHFLTPEEYLEIERKAETKSEYYNGEMFAMSGASRQHCQLGFRLNALLGNNLRNPCRGFTSDMRVRVTPVLYAYPDLTVACDDPQFVDDQFDTLLNPTFLVEILSPSTGAWDRGKKSQWYRTLPSLQEYLIIAQDAPEITLYRRTSAGWTVIDAIGIDESVELTSIGYTLRLRELYHGILADADARA